MEEHQTQLEKALPSVGRVRRARITDIPSLREILKGEPPFDAFRNIPPERVEVQMRMNLARCLGNPDHSVWAAETAFGKVAGYVSVHWLPYIFLTGPEGYISELFVRFDHRGGGWGKRLLEVVRQEAARRGCVRLHLVNNKSWTSYSRKFYLKAGWRERADTADFVLDLK